jgi:pimeloyl-ACP methyl ester carboxylesterase
MNVSGIVLVDGGVSELSTVPEMTWEKAETLLRPPEMDGMPREDFLARLKTWAQPFYSDALIDIVLGNFSVQEDDTIRRRLPIPRHMLIARALYDQKPSELFPRLRCPALLCPAIAPPPHDERTAQFTARKQEGVARAEQANALVQTQWFMDTAHDIPLHRPAELARAIVEFASA